MALNLKRLYDPGPYRLDAVERLLLMEGEPLSLCPEAFDTIIELLQDDDRMVGKEQVMRRIWPDSPEEEGNLAFNISILGDHPGEKQNQHPCRATIPCRDPEYVAYMRGMLIEGAEIVVKERTRLRIVIEEELLTESEDPAGSQSALADPVSAADSHQGRSDLKARLPSFSIIAIVVMISCLLLFHYGPQ